MNKIILPFKTFFDIRNEKTKVIELKEQYIKDPNFNKIINQSNQEFILNLETKTKKTTNKLIFNITCLAAFNFGNNCILNINCPKNVQNSMLSEWRYWDELTQNNKALIKCNTLNINAYNDTTFTISNTSKTSKLETININSNFYNVSLNRINFKKIKISKPEEIKNDLKDINKFESIQKNKKVKYSKLHICFAPKLELIDLSQYDDYIEIPKLKFISETCIVKINKNSYIRIPFETVFTEDTWLDEKMIVNIVSKSNGKMVFIYGALNSDFIDYLFVKADIIFDKKYLKNDCYELNASQMAIAHLEFQKKINGLYFDEKIKRTEYSFYFSTNANQRRSNDDELE